MGEKNSPKVGLEKRREETGQLCCLKTICLAVPLVEQSPSTVTDKILNIEGEQPKISAKEKGRRKRPSTKQARARETILLTPFRPRARSPATYLSKMGMSSGSTPIATRIPGMNSEILRTVTTVSLSSSAFDPMNAHSSTRSRP